MLWECSECAGRIERPRPPALCRHCGTAGVVFVEAEPGIDSQSGADSWREAWLEAGLNGGADTYISHSP
jgi:hypothetical protein